MYKPNYPGRPIVSAYSCPTENSSTFLDEVMSSLVRCLPTYVKDTNHALHIFDSFRFDNSDLEQYLLFIMDVKSLYTVIPNNYGLQALTYFLETRNVKVPSSLIRLAKLVLTLNAFSFNNVHHCQIGHVVMGGKMGRNYACLFHWIH